VALSYECLALGAGDHGRNRVARFVESQDPPRRVGWALVAGEYEHRVPDRREPVDGWLSCSEAGGLVRQRVGHRLEVGPERCLPHAGDVLLRCAGDAHERLECRTSVVGGERARAVDADHYYDKPVLEHIFYTYWSGLPVDSFTPYIRGDRGFAAIPTNDDLTLVLAACPFAQASAFRHDLEANYLATLELVPAFASKLIDAKREDRIVGGGVPNFFRKPFGPGWVLVGDAGHTKDPITAQGISDALRSAEWCADAIHRTLSGTATFDEALTDYHQQRDRAALPLYEFTTSLAALEPPPPELQELLAAIAGNQPAMDAFVSVTAGTLSPTDFFDPDNISRLVGTSPSAP